jgi:hypothetical protein
MVTFLYARWPSREAVLLIACIFFARDAVPVANTDKRSGPNFPKILFPEMKAPHN